MPPIVIVAFAPVGVMAGYMARPIAASFSAGRPANFVTKARTPHRVADGHIAPPFSTELLLAAVFVMLAGQQTEWLVLLAFCWLAALGTILALVDLNTRRMPNLLSLMTYAGVAGCLTGQAIISHGGDTLLRALLGGLALGAFYLATAVISKGGMGMGDVKLAASTGTALSWLGLPALVAGTLLGLLLAGTSRIPVNVARRHKREHSFAFGPFLVLGAVIALIANSWLIPS